MDFRESSSTLLKDIKARSPWGKEERVSSYCSHLSKSQWINEGIGEEQMETFLNGATETSLVTHQLRPWLPMKGTWVGSLVGELRSHIPWGNKTCAATKHVLQLLNPSALEPVSIITESWHSTTKMHHSQKTNKRWNNRTGWPIKGQSKEWSGNWVDSDHPTGNSSSNSAGLLYSQSAQGTFKAGLVELWGPKKIVANSYIASQVLQSSQALFEL